MTEKKDNEIKVPVKHKSTTFSPPLKYKVVSDSEINLTKARAFQFLELKTFDGERPVRERHVQFLYDEWSANRFLWPNIILASAKMGGEEYRINGQHTCWMRVNVPERYEPLDCRVRCMVYSVESDEQLRTLYSVFDRGAPRTIGHISKVLLMGGDAANDIPSSMLGQLLAGFKVFFSPDKHKRGSMNANDWAGLVENNYATLFNIAGRFIAIHRGETTFAMRAAVMGAVMATFEKNVKASEDFWKPVFDGIGLEQKTDARYQLRKYLQTHGHAIITKTIEKISQEEMYCVCLLLWNHWRNGDSVLNVKTISERPKVKS